MQRDQPFYSVMAHLSDFYGITMQDSDFEVIALHAWDHIGNKQFRLYKYHTHIPDCKEVELPCNADIIEGVFGNTTEFRSLDNVDRENFTNYNIETYINQTTHNTNPFFYFGKLLVYQRVGNKLIFEHAGHGITILYKGVIADEKGLPYLNFKEIDAIAKYCAFVTLQKKAFMTKDKATFEITQMMKQQWQFAVEDARTPILLNQNEMDQILEVMTSWDRKRYGISYKPLR